MRQPKPDVLDPCAEFGPTQRWALVWLLSVIFGGMFLTAGLASFDSFFYNSKGDVLDYQKYRENREAFSSLASDSDDPRSGGSSTIAASRARAK